MIGATPARAISPPMPETFAPSACTGKSCEGWSAICSKVVSPSFWNTNPRARSCASARQSASLASTECGNPQAAAMSLATCTSAPPVDVSV